MESNRKKSNGKKKDKLFTSPRWTEVPAYKSEPGPERTPEELEAAEKEVRRLKQHFGVK